MKVVIFDPSWIASIGLACAIEQLTSSVEIIQEGEAGHLERVLAKNADADFVFVDDVILADDEKTFFERMRRLAPEAAISILVGESDRERVLKAIYLGATAIIHKAADRETVNGTLRAIFAGQVAFPRRLLEGGVRNEVGTPVQQIRRAEPDGLTPREREVIGHIGTGKTVARIAADLKLSPHTVRVHVTHIMRKLDLRDRSSLIHYAVTQWEKDDDRAAPHSLS